MGSNNTRPDGASPLTDDDFWPLAIEFALSLKNWWGQVCEEFDLTVMQGHSLRRLDPERPVPMSILADALMCDASNVTGIVDKLESRGLIARKADEHDRRIKMLAVTDKGRILRERLSARMMEPPAAVMALPAGSRRQLAEVLALLLRERGGPSGLGLVPRKAD
jgi:DNA-binding MarR family transcriptional regulator